MTRWIITGHDSLSETFSTTISGNMATDDLIKRMLQALAARHLTESEVIAALNPISPSGLLEVRQDTGASQPTYTCGENPYFAARKEE